MKWRDLKDKVATVAPLLGGLLGGPAGAAAGQIVSVALGTDATPEAVASALADPTTLARLKEIEATHRIELQKMLIEQERMALADRADARARDVAIQQARGGNRRADVLAFAAIAGLVGLIYAVLAIDIPEGPARDVLLLLAGALVAITKDVYSFEFGSSRGSKEKTALMGRPPES